MIVVIHCAAERRPDVAEKVSDTARDEDSPRSDAQYLCRTRKELRRYIQAIIFPDDELLLSKAFVAHLMVSADADTAVAQRQRPHPPGSPRPEPQIPPRLHIYGLCLRWLSAPVCAECNACARELVWKDEARGRAARAGGSQCRNRFGRAPGACTVRWRGCRVKKPLADKRESDMDQRRRTRTLR